jgi:hypothetical protein
MCAGVLHCREIYFVPQQNKLVEALRYKPEGREFDFRWCHWNFPLA